MSLAPATARFPRVVLHVDMDAFFASVAQLDDPSLRGQPVIVGGHSLRRGVVSACSYEARAFGVRNAMPLYKALQLCPQARLARVNMARYREVNHQLREVWGRYSPVVDVASFDEAYLDLTGTEALLGPPLEVARRLQADVQATLSLSCSVGVGPNRLLAKVASKRHKPHGLCQVPADGVLEWLAPLRVRDLHGIGAATTARLNAIGITHVHHLQSVSPSDLVRCLGPGAEYLWQLAHGIDDHPVQAGGHAKSIGAERTFDGDQADPARLKAIFFDLVQEVAYRMRKAHVLARTITIKIRYADFETLERASTLEVATDDDQAIADVALTLFARHAVPGRALRLLGVRASGFGASAQLSWLAPEASEERRSLHTALDRLRERHGLYVVSRATHLEAGRRKRDGAGP